MSSWKYLAVLEFRMEFWIQEFVARLADSMSCMLELVEDDQKLDDGNIYCLGEDADIAS